MAVIAPRFNACLLPIRFLPVKLAF